jgi:hypothetical protein
MKTPFKRLVSILPFHVIVRVIAFMKWASVAIVSLLLLWTAINAFDQTLDTDVEAFSVSPVNNVPDRENAFYPMFGFAGPEDRDPYLWGYSLATQFEMIVSREVSIELFNRDNVVSREAEAFGAEPLKDSICSVENTGCIGQDNFSTQQLTNLLQRYRLFLERYEQLHRYTHYHDPLPVTLSSPTPRFSLLASSQQLMFGKAVLLVRRGEIGQAVALIERDMRFWRMVLREADDVLPKRFAQRFLERDVRFLSDAVKVTTSPVILRQVQALLVPLTAEELDYKSALHAGFRLEKEVLLNLAHDSELRRALGSDPPWTDTFLFRLYYQPNATVNRYYRNEFARQTAALNLPAIELARRTFNDAELSVDGWEFFYNPIGKIILARGFGGLYGDYARRLYDLEGLMRLTALQAKVKQQRIAADRIEIFVRNAGPAYADPYTGAPMRYEYNARRLYFLGFGKERGLTKRFEVAL